MIFERYADNGEVNLRTFVEIVRMVVERLVGRGKGLRIMMIDSEENWRVLTK